VEPSRQKGDCPYNYAHEIMRFDPDCPFRCALAQYIKNEFQTIESSTDITNSANISYRCVIKLTLPPLISAPSTSSTFSIILSSS
jgi:hypothetical protein